MRTHRESREPGKQMPLRNLGIAKLDRAEPPLSPTFCGGRAAFELLVRRTRNLWRRALGRVAVTA
jgi:hypothetical protein